jgi:hypothetical protein
MKVNFTKLKVRPSLNAGEIEVNANQEIGEMAYQSSSTLAQSSLSEKIYNAKGDIEISESDRVFLLSVAKKFKFWMQKSIIDILEGR